MPPDGWIIVRVDRRKLGASAPAVRTPKGKPARTTPHLRRADTFPTLRRAAFRAAQLNGKPRLDDGRPLVVGWPYLFLPVAVDDRDRRDPRPRLKVEAAPLPFPEGPHPW